MQHENARSRPDFNDNDIHTMTYTKCLDVQEEVFDFDTATGTHNLSGLVEVLGSRSVIETVRQTQS